MRYAVFGAGGVGPGIAGFLIKNKSTQRVDLVDVDAGRAKESSEKINHMGYHAHCSYMGEDVENITTKFLMPYDAVISALPASCNYVLAERSVNAGKNYCDLGGVNSVTEKMIANLDEKATRDCVSLVPDCGVMPGLGIMLVRILIEGMGFVKEALIYVGGVPQHPVPPLYYVPPFNIGGLESICFDEAPEIEKGEIVVKRPMTDVKNFKVKELAKFSPDGKGTVEAFNSAGASLAYQSFFGLVGKFGEYTMRWPDFVRIVSGIQRKEFSKTINRMIGKPISPDNPDLLWMKVVVSGNNITKTATLLELFDNTTGWSAMVKSTAFPAAVIAKYLARGQAKCGVKTPENAFAVYQLRQMSEELKKHLNLKIDFKAA